VDKAIAAAGVKEIEVGSAARHPATSDTPGWSSSLRIPWPIMQRWRPTCAVQNAYHAGVHGINIGPVSEGHRCQPEPHAGQSLP
jgi:hypothetical protein